MNLGLPIRSLNEDFLMKHFHIDLLVYNKIYHRVYNPIYNQIIWEIAIQIGSKCI